MEVLRKLTIVISEKYQFPIVKYCPQKMGIEIHTLIRVKKYSCQICSMGRKYVSRPNGDL